MSYGNTHISQDGICSMEVSTANKERLEGSIKMKRRRRQITIADEVWHWLEEETKKNERGSWVGLHLEYLLKDYREMKERGNTAQDSKQ
jgi:hypothetical protein